MSVFIPQRVFIANDVKGAGSCALGDLAYLKQSGQ
jgi:hypothetical protein